MSFLASPKKFKRLGLELSLKPFFDNSPETRLEVCERIYQQWYPLARMSEKLSILVYASEGSQILEYNRDLSQTIEWDYWLGAANYPLRNQEPLPPEDPENKTLFRAAKKYRDEPLPEFTYQWLKDLVVDLKTIGAKYFGPDTQIDIGCFFDPGPEFAISDFKYKRHTEILTGGKIWGYTFVGAEAKLHAEKRAYAAFPDGIEEGLPFGEFLGRQASIYCKDLGFSFIWLSNGLGFGKNPWSFDGNIFQPDGFHEELVEVDRDEAFAFWPTFLKAMDKSIGIRLRGSNMPAGIEACSDATPWKQIEDYAGERIEIPVNSPWAALDGLFGLELGGWMSRSLGSLEQLNYRYYIHDPWWMNSPWIDRYQRMPHDIYMPLAISRVLSDGSVLTTGSLALMSVNDSLGNMPDQVPYEVTSHLVRAQEDAPDQAAPVVWIYPFDELYADLAAPTNKKLCRRYSDDLYICGCIDSGVPISSFTSTTDFLKLTEEQTLPQIWYLPVPEPGAAIRKRLFAHVEAGGKAILYGAVDPNDTELLSYFGLQATTPYQGDLMLSIDGVATGEKLRHSSIFGGGPIELTPKAEQSASDAWALGTNADGAVYALAATHTSANGGSVTWLRAGSSYDDNKIGRYLARLSTSEYKWQEQLAVLALARIGIRLTYTPVTMPRGEPSRPVIHMLSRCRNGWFFSGYNRDAVPELQLSLPDGAPIAVNSRTFVKDNVALWRHPDKWWHKEVRIFVKQKEESEVLCDEIAALGYKKSRRFQLNGLKNADVIFYPETGTASAVTGVQRHYASMLAGDWVTPEPYPTQYGEALRFTNITGDLLISW